MDKELKGSRVAVVGSVVAGWALLTGFFLMFHQFARYDDEGYLMMTVKNFLDGWPLYDEVYSQYGPAFYLFKWVLHVPFSIPVTHSVTRLTGLLIWVLVALVSGSIVLRLTRSLVVAVIGAGTVFLGVSWLISEPGHPQDLCALLISLIILGAGWLRPEERLTKPVFFIGLLLGTLLLTKVNIGIFLGVALTISFVAYGPKGRLHSPCLLITATLAIFLPFAILYRYLDTNWLGVFILIELSLLANLVVNRTVGYEVFLRWRDHLFLGCGVAISILVLLCFGLLAGSSASGLLNGILLQHFKFGELFLWPGSHHWLAPYWAVIGVAAAIAFVLLGFRKTPNGRMLFIALKLAFSVCVIASALLAFFVPNYGYLILSFALPFTWLILVPDLSDQHQAARTLVAFGSILNALQVFPIAGTQLMLAAHLPIICGAVVLMDGLRELDQLDYRRFNSLVNGAAAAFIGILLIASISAFSNYVTSPPLELPGSSGLRLEDSGHTLSSLSSHARDDCTVLFSMPGMFSFNFWSGVAPPTVDNTTAWMTLLDDRRQSRIIAALERSSRPCVIYHPGLTSSAMRTIPLDSVPLANYIFENFQERTQIGDYIFLERRHSP